MAQALGKWVSPKTVNMYKYTLIYSFIFTSLYIRTNGKRKHGDMPTSENKKAKKESSDSSDSRYNRQSRRSNLTTFKLKYKTIIKDKKERMGVAS